MRRFLLTIAIIFASIISYGQTEFEPNYNPKIIGEWQGTLTRVEDTDETVVVRFKFYKSEHTGKLVCNRMYVNDAGVLYNNIDDNFTFVYEGNNAVYTWINTGGVWSETQLFMFAYTEQGIQLVHTRWVNNEGDAHNVWGYTEAGILQKD